MSGKSDMAAAPADAGARSADTPDGASTITMLPHVGQGRIAPMADALRTFRWAPQVVQAMLNGSTLKNALLFRSKIKMPTAATVKFYAFYAVTRPIVRTMQGKKRIPSFRLHGILRRGPRKNKQIEVCRRFNFQCSRFNDQWRLSIEPWTLNIRRRAVLLFQADVRERDSPRS